MSQVRFFPRYSQKENIVTNNVLLLMSRLYDYSRPKFGKFLAALGDEASDVAENLQLQFSQQRATGVSVVDGFIAQESLKIAVETKLSDGDYTLDQLRRHFRAFDTAKNKLLVLLSRGPTGPSDAFMSRIREEGQSEGIPILHATFEKVHSAAENCLHDHDEQMLAVVADFAAFCSEEGLLPRDEFTMLTPPCGLSFKDNRDYRLYYCPVNRNQRATRYLGIYANKSVRLIGEIGKIIACNIDICKGTVECGEEVSDEERQRMVDAARSARDDRGWVEVTREHIVLPVRHNGRNRLPKSVSRWHSGPPLF